MKISIITISYNNEQDIRTTIESVVNQTYKDFEYIIVDGASKDKTLEIVNEYKYGISKIISERDNGIYDAINKGIQAATGEIIGLIHAGDSLYSAMVIEKIANEFSKNSELQAIYGHSLIVNSKNEILRINRSPKFKKQLFKWGWMPSHQSFYAKKDVFLRYGLYNLRYKIASDYEFLLRVLYFNNLEVRLIDEYIVKFRTGGTSTKNFKNIVKLNKECINAWKNNGKKMPFYTLPLKLLRKIPQFVNAKLKKHV